MCLNIGTPKNHHFSFGTNGKVVVSGVPILTHFKVPSEILKLSYLNHSEVGALFIRGFLLYEITPGYCNPVQKVFEETVPKRVCST